MKKDINIGLNLLRVIMSFAVVRTHFGCGDIFGTIAVPVFMIMSFFFTEKYIIDRDNDKLKNRIERLVYPYILWAVIYWSIYRLSALFFDKHTEVKLSSLLFQIAFGHSGELNPAMWFHFDLIFFTIFMILMFFAWNNRKHVMLFLAFLVIVFFLAQYSGLNVSIFQNMRYEIKYPLGRLCETYSFAYVGMIMAKYSVCKYIQQKKFLLFGGSILFFCIIRYFNILVMRPDGFDYQGISLFLLSIDIFIVFYCIPTEHIPQRIQKFINFISSYSMGIYCVHFLVGRFIKEIMDEHEIQRGAIVDVLIIYFCSFLIAFLISTIPNKWCKKLVT